MGPIPIPGVQDGPGPARESPSLSAGKGLCSLGRAGEQRCATEAQLCLPQAWGFYSLPTALPRPVALSVVLNPHMLSCVLGAEYSHTLSCRERMAACGYPTVPRQCGGQHTLTHPLQRSLRLQLGQPSTPQALQPSSLHPSKVGMKKARIWRG